MNLTFVGLGIGFVLMGAGLFALTLRKGKPLPANPTKTQLREQAELATEGRKLRIAAAAVGVFGVVLLLLGIF